MNVLADVVDKWLPQATTQDKRSATKFLVHKKHKAILALIATLGQSWTCACGCSGTWRCINYQTTPPPQRTANDNSHQEA